MAVIYCRSTDGSDGDDGSTWALAKATLAAAVTAAGVGGTVYVSSSHSESLASGSMTLDSGVEGFNSPSLILCVDDTSDPEPPTALATGAVVGLGEVASTRIIHFLGSMYCYGIQFTTVTDNVNHLIRFASENALTSIKQVFENCWFNVRCLGAASGIGSTGGSNYDWMHIVELINCDISVNASASASVIDSFHNGIFRWYGGTLITGNPTNLVQVPSGARPGLIDIRDVDLSVLGSGQYLLTNASRLRIEFSIANCVLGASCGLVNSFYTDSQDSLIHIDNCSSSDVDVQFLYQNSFGVFQEDLAVYRSGGASDGVTAFSAQVVTTAAAEPFVNPLRVKLATLWADTSSAATFTAHIVHDSATNLQDDEIWIEVEYPDDTTTQSFLENDKAADIFATPADQTASTETWTGTGGFTNENKQKLSVTTSNTGKAGPVTVWLNVAATSKTLYACPKIEVV